MRAQARGGGRRRTAAQQRRPRVRPSPDRRPAAPAEPSNRRPVAPDPARPRHVPGLAWPQHGAWASRSTRREGMRDDGRHGSPAQVRARRGRDADPLVQHRARPAEPAAAGAAPRHPAARRPRGLRAAVPDGADPAGGLAGAVRRDPRRRPRRLPPVAAVAAVPRPPPRGGARHAGAHLLQVRGRLARRVAQAEHRRAAGVLQQAGRREEADHGDRGRPVGHGARLRVRALRPRVRGVAGRVVVRQQALPPPHDRGVRRHGAPLAVGPHRGRSPARGGPGQLHRLARHRHLRGRRGRGAGPRGALRARQRAQPRADAPDDHRRGGAAAAREGRRHPDPHRRLHRRRLELRRPVVPVPAREDGRAT